MSSLRATAIRKRDQSRVTREKRASLARPRRAMAPVLREIRMLEKHDVIIGPRGGDGVPDTGALAVQGPGGALGSCGSASASWFRDPMLSLLKTLCRWYSTVRGLMNSRAPISGLASPSRAKPAI